MQQCAHNPKRCKNKLQWTKLKQLKAVTTNFWKIFIIGKRGDIGKLFTTVI